MSIFIVGATGFIGFPVASALRRAGYIVYGLARTPDKASQLAQNEIIPIQGDLKDLAQILPATVEIVIDVSGLYHQAIELLELCKRIGGGRKPTDPKLGYIYTSGIWVHGSSELLISEATPLGKHNPPTGLVAWRPALEEQILASRDVLDVAIIRPGILYGGSGSTSAIWMDSIFKAKTEGSTEVAILGDASFPIALIHKDDLADFYVKVVQKLTIVAASTYPVFNASSHQEDLGTVASAFAKAIDYKGKVSYRGGTNPFEEAILTVVNIRHDKARGILGWQPTQIPFAQGMDAYAAAYQAWKK